LDGLDPVEATTRKRLMSDQRIKPAYKALTARRKRDGRYKLPAQSFGGQQEWAVQHIVGTALTLARIKPQVTIKREIDAVREKRNELARKVRDEAEKAEASDDYVASYLHAAAGMIEHAAEATQETRAFAMRMAWQFAHLFESPYCGLVARFTAVTLNLEIDLEVLRTRVRDWWKAYLPVLQREQAWQEQLERNEAADGDED
jgi:hypothetical protein